MSAEAPTIQELVAPYLAEFNERLFMLEREQHAQQGGGDTITQNTLSQSSSGGVIGLGGGAPITVAASNTATIFLRKAPNYTCTGANDEQVINKALEALGATGGEVQLLPGDFHLGTGATSFINAINGPGGITFRASGRREGAIIHVPEGSEAPCALRMAAYETGSHTARDLYISFDGVPKGTTKGVWMQCNEPQVKDVAVSHSAGDSFVLDGAPANAAAAVTNPTIHTYSGHVDGCEAYAPGQGFLQPGGEPADGLQTTALCQNTIITSSFTAGGAGKAASAVLEAELKAATEYTELTVSPLTQAIAEGDQLLLVDASTFTGEYNTTYTRLEATAAAAKGATTVKVKAFTPATTYKRSIKSFLVDLTKNTARNGFSIRGSAMLINCHPYYCYQSGADSYKAQAIIQGGEYENNGWTDVKLFGSEKEEEAGAPGSPIAPQQLTGASFYGNPCAAAVWAEFCNPLLISGCQIDGGLAGYGIKGASLWTPAITNNTILNAVTGMTSTSYSAGISLEKIKNGGVISGNAISNGLAYTGTKHYGLQFAEAPHEAGEAPISCTGNSINSTGVGIRGEGVGSLVINNSIEATGTAVEGTGIIARNNAGYNPVGKATPAVPASGSELAAALYDRTLYIKTAAGKTTIAIAGGPTIELTASALNTIRLPAQKVLTPTYENAPTWVVEGE